MLRAFFVAVTVVVLTLPPIRVDAQEDTEDRGSRAARKVQRSEVSLGYHAAAFGGVYAQDPRFGPLADLGVEAGIRKGKHRFEVDLDYLYEPFSTKSFNFTDEDQAQDGPTATERLIQSMHEVSLEPGWRAKLSPRLRLRASVEGKARFPEYPDDRRFSGTLRTRARWGELRKLFVELGGELFIRKYPGYYVADRRIDQRGFAVEPTIGWVFPDRSEVALGYELGFTDYLDARYDQLDAADVVLRAQQSKNYLAHRLKLDTRWRATSWLDVHLDYEFKLNDSQHYDREMTGRDATGAIEAKFIRDYYDYTRHTVELRLSSAFLDDRLEIDLVGETWFRDFATYEARDVDNVWTGELRHDVSVEGGLEAAYQIASFDGTLASTLAITAFVSHLHRASNMRREVSFATNYDITRAFLGLELESL